METLHVKDFLVIKEAKFDIKKINIIIGSQANGKSIIAKLIYLFSEVCGDILLKNKVFFVTLQKNIFSLLSGDINIDSIVKKFGSRYEFAKNMYQWWLFKWFYKKPNFIQKIAEEILVGKYINKNNEDWIETRGESIKLQDVSSDQQESLPMDFTLHCQMLKHFS